MKPSLPTNPNHQKSHSPKLPHLKQKENSLTQDQDSRTNPREIHKAPGFSKDNHLAVPKRKNKVYQRTPPPRKETTVLILPSKEPYPNKVHWIHIRLWRIRPWRIRS
ncbi:hypothetical protein Dimus_033773 [Dionaea muscipula]